MYNQFHLREDLNITEDTPNKDLIAVVNLALVCVNERQMDIKEATTMLVFLAKRIGVNYILDSCGTQSRIGAVDSLTYRRILTAAQKVIEKGVVNSVFTSSELVEISNCYQCLLDSDKSLSSSCI